MEITEHACVLDLSEGALTKIAAFRVYLDAAIWV
jgi:hypothetical protein